MTSDECLCSDDSSKIDNRSNYENLLPALSLSDVNDFVQEFLHQKCKVLKLIRDQISSRNSQNYMPERDNSPKHNGAADQSTPIRQKREVKVPQSQDATTNSDPIVESSRQQIFRNPFRGVVKKITSYRLFKWPLYFVSTVVGIFFIVYACSGFCLPRIFCQKRCPIVV
ncbi:hypothetical protein TSAR_007617 [Trichomalopsis sarcophagae]|uniref:Uncharacterized protein n=1 Tax=Trichomalopsis sarcophagae TaxID=543379 RepID=A0A232F369_9HYME|nr:hypothetical protein TSAR_007617 [Trichomalopsis sarcophagae]